MLSIKLKNDRSHCHSPKSNTTASLLEEIRERSNILIDLERRNYARSDFESRLCNGNSADLGYTNSTGTSSVDHKASHEFRVKICEWSYRVVDHFDVDREVVLTSFYFFDKFLSSQVTGCNPNFVQLVAMASLFLASKLNGPKSSAIPMECLASLSRSEFTAGHLAQMEMLLLRSLKWHVHPPTAKASLHELLGFLAFNNPIDEDILKDISKYAHYFAELSVYDSTLVSVRAIVIAVASLWNSWRIICEKAANLSNHQSLIDECCKFLQLQEDCAVFEDVAFVQNRLWELFCNTEEYSMSGQNKLVVEEPRYKRQRIGKEDTSPATVTALSP